jgi:hypothetical protein
LAVSGTASRRPAVIAGGVQHQDFEVLFQQADEGQKRVAAGFALVEVVRQGVGGRDHYHQAGEQGLEQPAEDHRIDDVVDLELVET